MQIELTKDQAMEVSVALATRFLQLTGSPQDSFGTPSPHSLHNTVSAQNVLHRAIKEEAGI